MNEDEIELLKEKMSTKICQLTRVVYLLNNKYLDSKAMIEAVTNSYEEEIENIVREANQTIVSLRKRYKEETSNANIEGKLKIITKKYEDIIQNINKEFEKIKSEKEEKEKELRNEYESKYNDMIQQIEQIKKLTKEKNEQMSKDIKKFKDDKDEAHKQILKLKEKGKKDIDDLNSKHKEIITTKDKEISNYKIQLKEKNDKLLNQNMEMSNFETEQIKIIKENETLKSEINNLKEKQNSLNEENAKLNKKNEKLQKEIISLGKFKENYTESEKLLEEKTNALRTLEKNYQSLIKEKEDLDIKHQLSNDKVKQYEKQMSLLKDESDKEKQNVNLMNNKIESIIKEYEEKIIILKEEKDAADSNQHQQIKNLLNEIEKLKNERNEQDAKIKKLLEDQKNKLDKKYTEEMDKIKFNNTMEVNELKLKYDSHISNLKIENLQLKTNESKNSESNKIIASLKKQIEAQRENNEKKEQEFKAYQVKIFQKMKEDFMEAINLLEKKNENLNQEIKDLENYISTRPPREEDVILISKLKKESEIKEQEIEELKEQVRQLMNGGNENNNEGKYKILNAVKIKKPKYTNASYGMIFSKK